MQVNRGVYWCLLTGLALVLCTLSPSDAATISKSATQDAKDEGPNDSAWCPYKTPGALDPDAIDIKNFYVTMRDGVRIAVTQYLPKSLTLDQKLPTILHSTRYMRAMDLRWDSSRRGYFHYPHVPRFLANGYAWISVDSRGSGASYGRWSCPWAPDEIKDYGEIVEWITKQPWSNGKVGCFGISYDGTTAEMTATNMNPAVKAVVPQFALFDAFADVGYPGGIHHSVFTEKWSKGNDALDRNKVTELIDSFIARLFVKGVKPVDDDKDGSLLRAAVASHVWNGDVHEAAKRGQFSDDRWLYEPGLSLPQMSPYGHVEALRASNVAFYGYSGWFDATYQHSAVKRFLTVANPGSKLVIGPWPHMGAYNADPTVRGTTKFDHLAEMMRFFDYHLKGVDTGIYREPPIHYYTMVEGKWKSADRWPPPAESVNFYFLPDQRLETTPPAEEGGCDTYLTDYTTGTGNTSRWDTLIGAGAVAYPDRTETDKKLLTYTSSPLDAETEVTGHGLITLYIASTAADGQFFAYLEDVGDNGKVQYVTEGELRALDRKISTDPAPYADVVPYHSYMRKDSEPIKPGQITELVFDLLPTSYLFKKGHAIRIALAGADKDHFHPPYFPPPTVTYYRETAHASHVTLPIVNRAALN